MTRRAHRWHMRRLYRRAAAMMETKIGMTVALVVCLGAWVAIWLMIFY